MSQPNGQNDQQQPIPAPNQNWTGDNTQAPAPNQAATLPDAGDATSVNASGASDTPGTPNPTSQTPQGQGSGNAGQQPASQDQGGPQVGPNTPPADKSGSSQGLPANDPNNPATHPLVKAGGIIHSIAQALGGGPRIQTTFDPNTGKRIDTPVQMSNGQIGKAIAIAALTGALSGLGEKGPGAEGRAAAGGAQQVMAQRQQQDAQQQAQAAQDQARQAQVTQTNFQTHQNALRTSVMEQQYHQQLSDVAKPILENVNAVGAALESGVHESDLLSKYHVTKDMAIPDGVVQVGKNPDGSDHYENTYTVIDPQKKIELPQQTAKLLADMRIPGYFTLDDKGNAVPKNFTGSAGIKAGLVVGGMAIAQGYQITENQINKQFAQLKGGDAEATQFDANLRQSLASGDITPTGLKIIGQYSNVPFDKAVDMMEKNKVDPNVIAQYRNLIPQDAFKQSADKTAADEAVRKAQAAVTEKAAVLPLEEASKRREEQTAAYIKSASVYKDEASRTQASIDTNVKNGIPAKGKASGSDAIDNLTHPELASTITDANYKNPDGVNHAFLDALAKIDPERAKYIQAIASGKDIQSLYAGAKKFGGSINADVHAYDPSFNMTDMNSYAKTAQEYAGVGKGAKTSAAASTYLEHLGRTWDAYHANPLAAVNGYSGAYNTMANKAGEESASFYANGNKPGEAELAHSHHDFFPVGDDGKTQSATKALLTVPDSMKTSARAALDKIEENYRQYDGSLPKMIERKKPVSVDAAQQYKRVTGEDIPDYLVDHKTFSRGGYGQNSGQPARQLPDGAKAIRDAQKNVVGYQLNGANTLF